MESLEEKIIIRLTKGMKKALKKLAEEDRRNLSDYLRLHLEKFLDEEKEGKKTGIK